MPPKPGLWTVALGAVVDQVPDHHCGDASEPDCASASAQRARYTTKADAARRMASCSHAADGVVPGELRTTSADRPPVRPGAEAGSSRPPVRRSYWYPFQAMPPPPKPPPGKKPPPHDQAAALRRRLTSDGFQAAPAPNQVAQAQVFGTDSAALDRSKAVAGIIKRLIGRAPISPELDRELLRVAKSPISGDEWQLIQRVVLSGPAPLTPQESKMESRRFVSEIEGPLARLANASFHLRLLREKGCPESDLFRGADLVLAEGGKIYERMAEVNAMPCKGPFPGARVVRLPTFGTLYFARHGEGDLIVRLEAPLEKMRLIAPLLMEFYEEHFVRDQNVGPMGCSPHTLRSGKPAIALCQ